MSRENVEIVRAAYDAYNRGDLEAVLSYAAPDFELDWSRGVGPQRGVYKLDQAGRLTTSATPSSHPHRAERVHRGR
jgi:ketosteroid isomerase-like protein